MGRARARRVVILDKNSDRIAEVRIPPCEDEKAIIPTAPPGWDFSGAVPRFDGTLVPLTGRKLEILRLLADGPPLQGKEIRDKLDPLMSEGTARWHVGDLRDALAKLFPGLAEPIENTSEGYRLTLR